MKKVLFSIVIVLSLILIGGICVPLFSQSKTTTTNNDVDFSTMTYVAMGDSITYGAKPNGVQLDKPYCVSVGENLGFANVVNLGIGGSTITGANVPNSMVSRLDTIPENADVISVLGGVNDWYRGLTLGSQSSTDLNTFYGAYKSILLNLKIKFPNAFIFVMTPLRSLPSENNALSDKGVALKQIAFAVEYVANLYDVPVLDLYSLSGYENHFEDVGTDGTHPNQEFTTNTLAPLISQFIKDNYNK